MPSDSLKEKLFDVDPPREWQTYGGNWEAIDGVMQNSSEQRGAKLMNGSKKWKNYSVEADVQLLGQNGDAGLILRASNEEVGVDSYDGYFAGIRDIDSTLVIGRADFGWHEYPVQLITPRIKTEEWYHLKFLAYDCDIAATARSPLGRTVLAYVKDPHCIPAGRFGLKSYASGGKWRNIRVRPATRKDLIEMIGDASPTDSYLKPSLKNFTPQALHRYMEPVHQEARNNRFDLNAQPIASLRLISPNIPLRVTIHGVVTLAHPILFIQDASGGIALPENHSSTPLEIGDEVEAKGEASLQDFGPILKNATVRVLWSDMPASPLAVTALQLSTGSYNGMAIEVEGRLQNKELGRGKAIVLTLVEGSQSFRAIAPWGSIDRSVFSLENGSVLRLRGICVLDSEYTHNHVPFAILLPSMSDVQQVRRAPWWNTPHIIMVVVCFLVLLITLQVFLNRMARWRLQAVLDERERLAMDMHDTLAQSFTGIGFQLQAVRDSLGRNETAPHQIDVALDMVRMSHQEAKRSIAALGPRSLGEMELIEALDDSARKLVDGGSINISSSVHGVRRVIPLRVFDGLFRIGQEAISNAIRHACPTQVLISLTFEKHVLRLLIEDDGVGFSTNDHNQGFGTRGAEKRAQDINAELQIESSPDHGTRVTVTATLDWRESPISRIPSSLRSFWRKLQ